jgi:hypothetical protein
MNTNKGANKMIFETYSAEAPTYGMLIRHESRQTTLDFHFYRWFLRAGLKTKAKTIKKYGLRFMAVNQLPYFYLILDWGRKTKQVRFTS